MARILVVDDEPKMTALVCTELEEADHTVETATDPRVALDLVHRHAFDVVITDLSMPGVSGMDVMHAALETGATDVIIMTAHGTVETAVEALKAGAADYLLKPFALDELTMLVAKLVKQRKTAALKTHFESEAASQLDTELIGRSSAAERLRKMIGQVAKSEATVLLTGKSGTGKELAAKLIHDLSPRARQPFIAINCAALTETLLESELFGHEKGAFTGAVARKQGRFELADSGTIFLDEIGEMPAPMQTKLLRVLEERTLVRVGGVDQIAVDVRVVAATNRDLKAEIGKGSFREDLFYRLNVFPIELPPLAQRDRDVIEIAEHLLTRARWPHLPLAADVRELLVRYDWPGNIRELRNLLERAMILAGGEPLTVEEFDLQTDTAPLPPGSGGGLEQTEKQMILAALAATDGNKTEAARKLHISRRRLYSRMKVHGIDP